MSFFGSGHGGVHGGVHGGCTGVCTGASMGVHGGVAPAAGAWVPTTIALAYPTPDGDASPVLTGVADWAEDDTAPDLWALAQLPTLLKDVPPCGRRCGRLA